MKKLVRTCVAAVAARVRQFGRDTGGQFAVLLGLSAIPLAGMSGLALDYGTALTMKARLDSAADAAALAATIDAAASMHKQQLLGQSDWPTAQNYGVARGTKVFAPTAGVPIKDKVTSWDVKLDLKANTITATVSYSTTVPTSFGKLFGIDTIAVSGTRVASQTDPVQNIYTQVVFLVDNSNSMTIGGTDEDTAALGKNLGCRFACHDTKWKFGDDCHGCLVNEDMYGWVRRKLPNVRLKYDYVKMALNDFMAAADTAKVTNDPHLAVSIYTFGTFWKKVVAGTSSMTTVANAVSNLSVEDATAVWAEDQRNASRPYGDHPGFTKTSWAMRKTLADLQDIGDGSTSSARKTFVVLITDGVEDVCSGTPCNGRNTGQMFNPDACKAMKDKNITLITVATPYPVLDRSDAYRNYVAPIADGITPSMMSCSSNPSKYYFEASNGPAIRAKAAEIFSAIYSTLWGSGNTVLVR